MIDLEKFRGVWAHLCARFNRAPDPQQAVAYHDYLTELMDTEEFLAAARAVWATSRFFPRPADFLTVGAGGDWGRLLAAAAAYRQGSAEWLRPWNELSPRGRAAAAKLGDITTIRAIYDRDVVRLRAAFLAAYEEAAVDQVLALPAPGAKALPAPRPARAATTRGLELLSAGPAPAEAPAPSDPEAERIREWEEAHPQEESEIRSAIAERVQKGGAGIPKAAHAQLAWAAAQYRHQVLALLGRAPAPEEPAGEEVAV